MESTCFGGGRNQAVSAAIPAAMSDMSGLTTRTENVNKNFVEILVKRVSRLENPISNGAVQKNLNELGIERGSDRTRHRGGDNYVKGMVSFSDKVMPKRDGMSFLMKCSMFENTTRTKAKPNRFSGDSERLRQEAIAVDYRAVTFQCVLV